MTINKTIDTTISQHSNVFEDILAECERLNRNHTIALAVYNNAVNNVYDIYNNPKCNEYIFNLSHHYAGRKARDYVYFGESYLCSR